MTQQTNSSLQWVEVTAPSIAPHWGRISRVLKGVDQIDYEDTVSRLKAGQRIDCEVSRVSLHCPPMSKSDQRRLAHLADFETGGFQLTTFGSDTVLFYRNDQDYYSMREMAERGFLPTSAIVVDRLNAQVTDFHGQLIDVFVPVGQFTINFFNQPL